MRNLSSYALILAVLLTGLIKPVKAQVTTIPDPNFEQALINLGLDIGPVNGSIPTANIMDVTTLDVANRNISDLTGIQDFMSLTRLLCNSNKLSSLNVTRNTALTSLLCDRNRITALDVTKNTELVSLLCSNNLISVLDLTKNTKLRNLGVDDNRLQNLDITRNIALISLGCGNNKLTSLDVTKNTALTSLGCESNSITFLDVTKNTQLTSFGFEKNLITAIDLTKNLLLYSLVCYNNLLTDLDLKQNANLNILDCSGNKLSSLDVTRNPKLTVIRCLINQISALDLSKNTALITLWCYNNSLTELDVTNNTLLNDLRCNNNFLTSLNLKNGANATLTFMVALSNPNLKCIQVDDELLSAGYVWWSKDPTAQYGKYCTPTFSSFSPAIACTGQAVIIRGTNLNVVTAVNFGGVPASSVSSLSGTSVKAIVGNGASGNIEVITPGGTANLPGFTFKQSGPPATISISSSSNDICPTTTVTFTAVSANVGTTPSFQWKLNGINVGGNSRTYTHNNFTNGDRISCVMNTITECPAATFANSNIITMNVKPVPGVSLSPADTSIAQGTSISLSATVTGNFLSYAWTPSIGLNNAASLNPISAPAVTTVYNLDVISPDNCSVSKKIKISVYKYVRIPNSFSPNGDGLNDIFRIPADTKLDLQVFAIYDRLGNEIFKTSDVNKGWDGRYKGQMASPGVYIYLLKGSDPGGDVFLKGTVLLIIN